MADVQAAKLVFQMETTGTAAALKNFDQIKNKLESLNKTNTFENMGKQISQTGRNMQWLGQRLTFGLSLPLALFGKQAIDVAKTINESFTDLRRVWSGNADDIDNKLRPAAIRLSNTFGIAQEEIVTMFADLNKAGLGKTAEELESLGKIANQTALIFGIDLASATDQVKSLMLGFQLSVEDTSKAVDAMNIIADKTAASEQGIIDSMQIMSGLARQTGMSIRDLAAITAVFEANNISASEGANALKFSISRLRTPTDVAVTSMKAFGLRLDTNEFKMKSSTEQLLAVSKKFKELQQSSDKTKFVEFNNALADLVGRRQLSRFTVLMEDMARSLDTTTAGQSQFATALSVSSNQLANMEFTQKQLGVTMDQESKKIDIAKQQYRNLQAEIGDKLLPMYVEFLKIIGQLVSKYNALTPAQQDFIIKAGLVLIAIGPLLSVLGAFTQLLGFTLEGINKIIGALSWLKGALGVTTAGFAVIVSAVGAFIWAIDQVISKKGEITGFWDAVVSAMAGPVGAFMSIVNSIEKIKSYFGQSASAKVMKNTVDSFNLQTGKGIIPGAGHNGGLIHASNGAIIPGHSPLRDRVPVMAEQGEGIMSRKAIENLLSNGSFPNQAGPTYNINFNPGVMIATPGEQRAFARDIKKLIEQDNARYAQTGPIFRGLTA